MNNSSTALSPSSRYILSGHSTSENLRNKILSKFYPSHNTTNRHEKSLSESFAASSSSTIPLSLASELDTITNNVDPWCVSFKSVQENAILSNWLQKYDQPTFAFTKTWKKRYFVLVDRILYTFKTTKLTTPAKDHFLLTEDTFVFVTEEFKKGYTIELRKPFSKWYIRCDSIDQMRLWLGYMKKIVACVKIGYDGLLTSSILNSITLTDDYRIIVPTKIASIASDKKQYRQSLPTYLNERKPSTKKPVTIKRQSLQDIPNWQATLPPQLPPPKTKPPPVPLIYINKNLPTVSEDI